MARRCRGRWWAAFVLSMLVLGAAAPPTSAVAARWVAVPADLAPDTARDLTGDGTSDQLDLSASSYPGRCTARVVAADTTGPYAGVRATIELGFHDVPCPDLLADVDLRGDGRSAIVMTGWSTYVDPRVYVVRADRGAFSVDSYPGLPMTNLDIADLDGDGLPDVLEVTDELPGIYTFLGRSDGTLAPELALRGGSWPFATWLIDTARADVLTEALLSVSDAHGGCGLAVYAHGVPLTMILSSGHFPGLAGCTVGPQTARWNDVNGDGLPDVQVGTEAAEADRFTAFQAPDHSFYLGIAQGLSAGQLVEGDALGVSAVVGQSAPGGAPVGGEVSVLVDGVVATTAPLTAGATQVQVFGLSAGRHQVRTRYEGDGRHAAVSSAPEEVRVVASGTQPAATSLAIRAAGTNPASLIATVASGGFFVCDGTVTVKEPGAGRTLATSAAGGDPCTFSLGPIAAGTRILVSYAPASSLLAASTTGPLVWGAGGPETMTVAATPASGPPHRPVTLTAHLTGVSGATVAFYDGETLLGWVPVTSGADPTLTVTSLAAGPHNLLAVLRASSGAVVWSSDPFGVAYDSPFTDEQTVVVTVPAGALTITTPYTPEAPLDLGVALLDQASSTFHASAPFRDIVITDARAGNLGFAASVSAAPFSGPSTIPPDHLGLVEIVREQIPGNGLDASSVMVSDCPANAPGLGQSCGFARFPAGRGLGSVRMSGVLRLEAVPSSVASGVYSTTLTFTAM